MTETAHIGRKISRLRELRGMKQETLAEQLGISQQAVSKIEQSESVDDLTLDRIAKALSLSVEAIRNYNDEKFLNLIQHNTFNDNSTANTLNYQCTFNPLDEIKRLNSDKEELYKSLIKEKEEKIQLLQKGIQKLEEKK